MFEGIKIILTYDSVATEITSAPEGIFDLDYSMARSEKYFGMMPKYSGRLGFVKDGKTYIDNILNTYGKHSVITFAYQIQNKTTAVYEDYITGTINLVNYSRELLKTFVDFEGDEIEMKFNSRHEIERPYYKLESLNGTTLSGFSNSYINLNLQGKTKNFITQSVAPFELFLSLFQQALDINRSCLYSTIFGRTDLDNISTLTDKYISNGAMAYWLLFKGTWGRGIEDDLSISIHDAFDFYNKIKPIGLGFIKDVLNRDAIIIEDRNYFFQERIILELDDSKISDYRKEFGKEFSWNEILIGSAKKVKDEVPYGKSEYNVKVNYATESISENTKLDLTNNVRTDGVAINDLIENYSESSTEGEYDDDIFMVDAMEEIGSGYTMTNYKDENYQAAPTGIDDANYNLYYNLDFSPARILIDNWGQWLNITLQDLNGKLRFNKAETLSKLKSLRNLQTDYIEEKTDILYSVLETPIMTGNIIYFNYPLSESEVITIKNDFYGQIKFWNPDEKKNSGGWLKTVNTKASDEQTNFEIYEAVSLAEVIGL
ncbi:MAG: hypothetical protein M0R03_20400, partial [Novosphingobium sp.]|nr:hypothetical protein [Novosphingobium sp.]